MFSARLRVACLALADLAAIYLSWLLVIWGYRAAGFGYYAFGADFYLKFWPIGVAFVLLNMVMRIYHRSVLYPAAQLNPVEEFRRLVGSAAIVHLGTIAALALMYQTTEYHSRAVIVLSGVLTAVVAQPVRNLVRSLLRRLGIGQIPVVLVGEGALADRVAKAIGEDPYIGFRIAPADARIAVVCRDPRLFKVELADLAKRFTHIEYVMGGDAFPVFGAQAVSLDGIGVLELVSQRGMKAIRLEKWVLDKVLSAFAFVVLSPFFIVVPLLIKLTSRGPVFYRQERLGRNGRRIRVWKFRSMYRDADARLARMLETDPVRKAEWEANFKLADDPRVTPFGRFLRKTSIDEFPQLFNVFAGDMALVGPRPIVAREVPLYGSAYETFASVLPGITGLWQVSGRSGIDYATRVALDTYYVLNWSPWMDVWILFRTVGAVLFMRGAC